MSNKSQTEPDRKALEPEDRGSGTGPDTSTDIPREMLRAPAALELGHVFGGALTSPKRQFTP